MTKNISSFLPALSVTPQYFPAKEQSTICKIIKLAGFLLALPFLLLADLFYAAFYRKPALSAPNPQDSQLPQKTDQISAAPLQEELIEITPPPEIIVVEPTPVLPEPTPPPIELPQTDLPAPPEETPPYEPTPEIQPSPQTLDPIVPSPQEDSSPLTRIGLAAFGALGLGAVYLLNRYGQSSPLPQEGGSELPNLGQCASNHSNFIFNNSTLKFTDPAQCFSLNQPYSLNQCLIRDCDPSFTIPNCRLPQTDTPDEIAPPLLIAAEQISSAYRATPQTRFSLNQSPIRDCDFIFNVSNCRLPREQEVPIEAQSPLFLSTDPEQCFSPLLSPVPSNELFSMDQCLIRDCDPNFTTPNCRLPKTDTPDERTPSLLIAAEQTSSSYRAIPQTRFSLNQSPIRDCDPIFNVSNCRLPKPIDPLKTQTPLLLSAETLSKIEEILPTSCEIDSSTPPEISHEEQPADLSSTGLDNGSSSSTDPDSIQLPFDLDFDFDFDVPEPDPISEPPLPNHESPLPSLFYALAGFLGVTAVGNFLSQCIGGNDEPSSPGATPQDHPRPMPLPQPSPPKYVPGARYHSPPPIPRGKPQPVHHSPVLNRRQMSKLTVPLEVIENWKARILAYDSTIYSIDLSNHSNDYAKMLVSSKLLLQALNTYPHKPNVRVRCFYQRKNSPSTQRTGDSFPLVDFLTDFPNPETTLQQIQYGSSTPLPPLPLQSPASNPSDLHWKTSLGHSERQPRTFLSSHRNQAPVPPPLQVPASNSLATPTYPPFDRPENPDRFASPQLTRHLRDPQNPIVSPKYPRRANVKPPASSSSPLQVPPSNSLATPTYPSFDPPGSISFSSPQPTRIPRDRQNPIFSPQQRRMADIEPPSSIDLDVSGEISSKDISSQQEIPLEQIDAWIKDLSIKGQDSWREYIDSKFSILISIKEIKEKLTLLKSDPSKKITLDYYQASLDNSSGYTPRSDDLVEFLHVVPVLPNLSGTYSSQWIAVLQGLREQKGLLRLKTDEELYIGIDCNILLSQFNEFQNDLRKSRYIYDFYDANGDSWKESVSLFSLMKKHPEILRNTTFIQPNANINPKIKKAWTLAELANGVDESYLARQSGLTIETIRKWHKESKNKAKEPSTSSAKNFPVSVVAEPPPKDTLPKVETASIPNQKGKKRVQFGEAESKSIQLIPRKNSGAKPSTTQRGRRFDPLSFSPPSYSSIPKELGRRIEYFQERPIYLETLRYDIVNGISIQTNNHSVDRFLNFNDSWNTQKLIDELRNSLPITSKGVKYNDMWSLLRSFGTGEEDFPLFAQDPNNEQIVSKLCHYVKIDTRRGGFRELPEDVHDLPDDKIKISPWNLAKLKEELNKSLPYIYFEDKQFKSLDELLACFGIPDLNSLANDSNNKTLSTLCCLTLEASDYCEKLLQQQIKTDPRNAYPRVSPIDRAPRIDISVTEHNDTAIRISRDCFVIEKKKDGKEDALEVTAVLTLSGVNKNTLDIEHRPSVRDHEHYTLKHTGNANAQFNWNQKGAPKAQKSVIPPLDELKAPPQSWKDFFYAWTPSFTEMGNALVHALTHYPDAVHDHKYHISLNVEIEALKTWVASQTDFNNDLEHYLPNLLAAYEGTQINPPFNKAYVRSKFVHNVILSLEALLSDQPIRKRNTGHLKALRDALQCNEYKQNQPEFEHLISLLRALCWAKFAQNRMQKYEEQFVDFAVQGKPKELHCSTIANAIEIANQRLHVCDRGLKKAYQDGLLQKFENSTGIWADPLGKSNVPEVRSVHQVEIPDEKDPKLVLCLRHGTPTYQPKRKVDDREVSSYIQTYLLNPIQNVIHAATAEEVIIPEYECFLDAAQEKGIHVLYVNHQKMWRGGKLDVETNEENHRARQIQDLENTHHNFHFLSLPYDGKIWKDDFFAIRDISQWKTAIVDELIKGAVGGTGLQLPKGCSISKDSFLQIADDIHWLYFREKAHRWKDGRIDFRDLTKEERELFLMIFYSYIKEVIQARYGIQVMASPCKDDKDRGNASKGVDEALLNLRSGLENDDAALHRLYIRSLAPFMIKYEGIIDHRLHPLLAILNHIARLKPEVKGEIRNYHPVPGYIFKRPRNEEEIYPIHTDIASLTPLKLTPFDSFGDFIKTACSAAGTVHLPAVQAKLLYSDGSFRNPDRTWNSENLRQSLETSLSSGITINRTLCKSQDKIEKAMGVRAGKLFSGTEEADHLRMGCLACLTPKTLDFCVKGLETFILNHSPYPAEKISLDSINGPKFSCETQGAFWSNTIEQDYVLKYEREEVPVRVKAVTNSFKETQVSVSLLPAQALKSPRNPLQQAGSIMPIGIPNEGDTCFIASALQLILKDPILEEALIEEARDGGDAREFGEFLQNYRNAQKSGKPYVTGVKKLRDALCRISRNPAYKSSQWDANEVFRTLVSDESSSLYQRLLKKGYFITESVRRYYVPPENETPHEESGLIYDPERGTYYSEREARRPAQIEVALVDSDAGKPIKELIDAAWVHSIEGEPGNYLMQSQKTVPCEPLFQAMHWDVAPNSIMVSLKRWDESRTKVGALIQVKEEISIGNVPMRLAGFTLHSGSTGGGHWISYSSENGRYTCNDDGTITEISQEEYLSYAQGASDLLYQKTNAISRNRSGSSSRGAQ